MQHLQQNSITQGASSATSANRREDAGAAALEPPPGGRGQRGERERGHEREGAAGRDERVRC